MKEHKRIILVGHGGSGKDTARKRMEANGFVYAVSYTTRPPREGEVDGKDYIFISPEEADRMKAAGEFYECIEFNGWNYGTTKEQFYRDDVFIMTPGGISHIKPEDRKTSLIMFFDVDETIRRKRLFDREMPGDSVERRILADRNDFSNFKDYDIRVTNPDF